MDSPGSDVFLQKACSKLIRQLKMAANTKQELKQKKRYSSFLRECCPEKCCQDDIYTLHDRIEMMEFQPLFGGYIHYDKKGEIVTTFPNAKKFSEFLYDFCDYNCRCWMNEKYVSSDEVSMLGRGKIKVMWRVLDKYGARFDGQGYTRNIVDVQVIIPELNLVGLEHFCYRYMSRRTGEPAVVVPRLLRKGIARLYNRFFVFEGPNFDQLRVSLRCNDTKCHHKDQDPVPEAIKSMIPPWYYARAYPPDTSALVVSVT